MNLYHKLLNSTLAVFLLQVPALAGVLPFYNPLTNNNTSARIQVQSIVANDALSLEGIFNDKESSLSSKSGNYIAISSQRYDIGASQIDFGYLGYTYRNDVFIDASNDAMNLIYLTKYKKDIPLNKTYDLSVYSQEYISHGITYSNSFEVYKDSNTRINLALGASFVIANDAQSAQLKGSAQSLGNKDYNFEAELLYAYNKNYLYEYNVDASVGYGFNTYLALEMNYERFDIKFIANDIGAKIYWDNLAYSSITATSENKEYDENGYPIYKPVLKGKEGYASFTQSIEARYRLDITYTFEEGSKINLGSDYFHDVYFPYIEVEHSFYKDVYNYLSYEQYFSMVGLGVRYKAFNFELKSDSFKTPKSVSLFFSGNYYY